MIGALVLKDLKLFFRNQFFAVITVLGLVAYIAIYFLLPSEVNDAFNLAIYLENPEATAVDETFAQFMDYTLFDSESEMLATLEEEGGEYFIGLSISEAEATARCRSPSMLGSFSSGSKPG